MLVSDTWISGGFDGLMKVASCFPGEGSRRPRRGGSARDPWENSLPPPANRHGISRNKSSPRPPRRPELSCPFSGPTDNNVSGGFAYRHSRTSKQSSSLHSSQLASYPRN